jgi:hypothetical protein
MADAAPPDRWCAPSAKPELAPRRAALLGSPGTTPLDAARSTKAGTSRRRPARGNTASELPGPMVSSTRWPLQRGHPRRRGRLPTPLGGTPLLMLRTIRLVPSGADADHAPTETRQIRLRVESGPDRVGGPTWPPTKRSSSGSGKIPRTKTSKNGSSANTPSCSRPSSDTKRTSILPATSVDLCPAPVWRRCDRAGSAAGRITQRIVVGPDHSGQRAAGSDRVARAPCPRQDAEHKQPRTRRRKPGGGGHR